MPRWGSRDRAERRRPCRRRRDAARPTRGHERHLRLRRRCNSLAGTGRVGNAQRYLLTGDTLTAEEAYRIGLVQDLVPEGIALERATALATTIARAAPLGIKHSLAVSRLAVNAGPLAATKAMVERRRQVVRTDDAAEGVASFVEKREANFVGR